MSDMKTCAECGQPITGKHGNNRKYCSIQCRRKAEARGRMEYISRRSASVAPIRQDVIRTYKAECAICGWKAADKFIKTKRGYGHSCGNEIHHITPVYEGGGDTWDNVILLCPNHHKQADYGIIERNVLRSYVRPFEALDRAKNGCSDAITRAIFDDKEERP